MLRTDLLVHRAAMLRQKRAIELAQLPIRHVRLYVVVAARVRQNRGYDHTLDDGREYLLAGANEVLHTTVLLDHGGCGVVIMTAFVSAISSEIDNAEPLRFEHQCALKRQSS